VTIQSKASTTLTAAFPTRQNTGCYIWKGTTVTTGANADWANVFQGVNFNQIANASPATPVFTGFWSQNNQALTIVDAGGANPGLPNGDVCTANGDCASNNCVSGVCTAVDSGGSSDTTSSGLPWW
jgi:hypothetical protein